MVEGVRIAKERVERLEAGDEGVRDGLVLVAVVQALQALRGVDLIVAVTFVTEVGDVSGFESPRQLMGYLASCPDERSTGATVRRGGITKAGNGRVRHMLVEIAWTYRHPPEIGSGEALHGWNRPRSRVREIAWKAQTRLTARYRALQRTGQEDDRGLHGDRPRVRRLHVGGLDGRPVGLIHRRQSWRYSSSRKAEAGPGRGNPVSRFVAGIRPTPAVR